MKDSTAIRPAMKNVSAANYTFNLNLHFIEYISTMKKKSKALGIPLMAIMSLGLCFSCKQTKKVDIKEATTVMEKGTFGYDKQFLKEHYKNTLVLSDETSVIIVVPELQGRVMTSSVAGDSGQSFGWINHDLIASGEKKENFNPTGGEERFWLGPEGGQYALYFAPETSFEIKNWYVPKEIDTEAFNLVKSTATEAIFEKKMELLNYANTTLKIKVDRKVSLLDVATTQKVLGTTIPSGLKMVGFETDNKITNIGHEAWNQTTGMPSIWILSMLKPSDHTTVVIPFNQGDESSLGKIVTDYEFDGPIPSDRLVVKENALLFKADGKKRSKIGLTQKRALPLSGSYDSSTGVLTIAQYSLPLEEKPYVNSLWKIQEKPYEGDALNSYNDGPLEDGGQLGPFYELESSSPAANLGPNESLGHTHRTFHFSGDTEQLDQLAKALLHISLKEIMETF